MILHFVYAGAPDNTLRQAPYTITRNLYRFFRSKGLDVRYYDLNETRPVSVGPDDLVLGHPAIDPGTVLQRMFREAPRCRAKCIIQPLHHGIPQINLPHDPLARQADVIFGIMGPYWYDTLDRSPFAHWKPKLVRVDMAVEAGDFPFMKSKFNPPERRGLLYIGRDSPEKGPAVLYETVRRLPETPFIYLGWLGQQSPIRNLPNLRVGQPVELTGGVVEHVAAAADVFLNTSVSDANPTTLLEAAAWGFIPCCTKQSGYYGDERCDELFTELFVDDIDENVRRVKKLLAADEQVLVERARRGREVVERKYNWERFCATVWSGLEPYVSRERVEVNSGDAGAAAMANVATGTGLFAAATGPAGVDLARPETVRKLLIVRPDNIGDNVLAACMIPPLRRHFPAASIAVVCQQQVAPLYEACPDVAAVVGFDKRRAYADEAYRNALIADLRSLGADLVLHTVYSRELIGDFLAVNAGAPIRIAMRGDLQNIPPEQREANDRAYTHLAESPGPWKPEILRHRDFLQAVGALPGGEPGDAGLRPQVWTNADDAAAAERLMRDHGLEPDRTLAIFAGSGFPQKDYDGYGAALAPFCRDGKYRVVALGAAEAAELNRTNLRPLGDAGMDLSGKTTLRQSAEVLRRCRLAVGADTGLAHVACAVGTPNVVLVGGGHFGRFFPYSPLTSAACLPLDCYGNGWNCKYAREFCVKDVQPAVLTAAVHEALGWPRGQVPARPRLYVQDRSLWETPGAPQPPGARPNWTWIHPMIDRLSLDMVTVGRRGGLPLPGGGAGAGSTEAECTAIRLPWRHRQRPAQGDAAADQLATQRRQAAAAVLQTTLNDLPQVVPKVAQLLRASAVREAPARPEEMHLVDEIYSGIGRGAAAHGAIQYRIAAMFYFRPHELPAGPAPQLIPDWLLEDYLRWTVEQPEMFYEEGEADAYGRYLTDWVAALERLIVTDPESPLNQRYRDVANLVAQLLNFIPLYFHGGDLVAPLRSRAAILRHVVRASGLSLEHSFPPRGGRAKIRLGVIQNQFAPQTETYASIPLFKDLPRDRFEVILYALAQTTSPAEEQCRSLADRFVVLPAEPKAQADAIRADDLDVLFFGTNLTAVTHPLVLLASLRLARVQATALHSPVTTGMETMDRFLLGLAGRDTAEAERAYVEELAVIDEPGMAFDFTSRPAPSDFKVDRAALNVPADAVLFASGANFYKIIPEVRRAWARILAAVPGSYLVLYPFGPAWSNQYAAGGFLRSFYTTLAEHGVEGRRLVVMQPLPSPADIGKLLAVCDVYLDSFPYAGAVSMIDALEAAVPPVAVAGGPQRFAQAAALLRSVGLDELIAGDAEDYVQLAVALARDPGRRERLSDEVRRRMTDGPRFLDTGWYAGQVAGLFERICGK